MNSISVDLVMEIFSRLPSKSVARFRCASKLWGYMFHGPYFTELFLTRSWARPRLLFSLRRDNEWSFFSSPQLQNPYDGKVSVGFHMRFSIDMYPEDFRGLTSGLIYFSGSKISREKYEGAVPVIFNPTTRRYAILPNLGKGRISESILGFDPIDKQFKVLSMSYPYSKETDDHRILTLGSGKMSWRKIQCPSPHGIWSDEGTICINRVLYYLAEKIDETYLIVCFDVRSEKFKFVDAQGYNYADFHTIKFKLINYKGKFGTIRWDFVDDGNTLELSLWVLEDVEKQEWSKSVYTLPIDKLGSYNVSIAGVTATGEIVLLMDDKYKPFYVFYFKPERKTFQRVEIQGFGDYYHENHHYFSACVDYVEDLHVNDAKYLKYP